MKTTLRFRRRIVDKFAYNRLMPEDTLGEEEIILEVSIKNKDFNVLEKLMDGNVPHEFSNHRQYEILIEFLGE